MWLADTVEPKTKNLKSERRRMEEAETVEGPMEETERDLISIRGEHLHFCPFSQ